MQKMIPNFGSFFGHFLDPFFGVQKMVKKWPQNRKNRDFLQKKAKFEKKHRFSHPKFCVFFVSASPPAKNFWVLPQKLTKKRAFFGPFLVNFDREITSKGGGPKKSQFWANFGPFFWGLKSPKNGDPKNGPKIADFYQKFWQKRGG